MRLWAALAGAVAGLCPAAGEAACRLALALALDVSGSVDEQEYALQLNGVADALVDTQVRAAFLGNTGAPVALAIYEWSSSTYQRQVLDWVLIESADDLEAVRATLLGWRRAPAPEATGLGAALLYAKDLFARGPMCWQQTLDISGDGKNNDWPIPERLRKDGRLQGMNVNALVVARDFQSVLALTPDGVTELSAYFKTRIIQGPGAFIEVAVGYEDYARAMQRKLLRELATVPLGENSPENDEGPRRTLAATAPLVRSVVSQ